MSTDWRTAAAPVRRNSTVDVLPGTELVVLVHIFMSSPGSYEAFERHEAD